MLINVMIGHPFILLHEVDSTNNYAATLLAEGKLAHGTVILAEKQTSGRGQRGNSWTSDSGNQFACSVYVETAFLSAEDYLYLNFAVALAVRSTLQHFSHEKVLIKWPNDLLVRDKKISGVLVEAQWQQGRMAGAVIGVGINRFREAGLASAIALEELSDKVPQIREMAELLSMHLEEQFQRLKRSDWDGLVNDYHQYLWRLMEETLMQTPDGAVFMGKIMGIERDGDIRIQTPDGEKTAGLQEVRFIY